MRPAPSEDVLNVVHFAYQAIPAANPAAQAPAPGASDGSGSSPGAFGGTPLMMLMFLPVILILVWQSRSQQKKQEQAVSSLKKGDRVVTQGGVIGRLVELDNRYAKLEIATGVKVTVLRSSVVGRDAEDSAKKDDAGKKDESKKSEESAEAKK